MADSTQSLREYALSVITSIPPARSRVAVLRVIGQIVNGPIELDRSPSPDVRVPEFSEDTYVFDPAVGSD